jgi:hypothetical protein
MAALELGFGLLPTPLFDMASRAGLLRILP